MNKGEKRAKAEFDVLGKIREEKEKRGWTDYQLAENSGLTQSTLSTWNKRDIEPGIASIEKICSGLGITLSQFFSQSDNPDQYSSEQKQILEIWGKLSPTQRKSVLQMLNSFLPR